MKFRVEAKAIVKLWTDVEARSRDEAIKKALARGGIQPLEDFADADSEEEWAADAVDTQPEVTMAYPIEIS
jgi:hypothetical protein